VIQKRAMGVAQELITCEAVGSVLSTNKTKYTKMMSLDNSYRKTLPFEQG
jgi:hypothetical protein